MKVIKHGKNFINIICSNCNCLYQIKSNEAKKETKNFNDYDVIIKYFKCPECHTKIIIETRGIEK